MAVGDKIRTLRKRAGLSMKQLAEKVGVSYLTIYRIETSFELAYVTKGKSIIKHGNKEYTLNEGDLLYYKGETPHTVFALEPHEFIIIHFIEK